MRKTPPDITEFDARKGSGTKGMWAASKTWKIQGIGILS